MKSKLLVFVVILIAVAGTATWLFVDSNKDVQNDKTSKSTSTERKSPVSDEIEDVATFTVPEGWKEEKCPKEEAAFFVPAGAPPANCATLTSFPVKIFVDQNTTNDCSQLDNQSNVKEHTCKSLFINGNKSLQSSTKFTKMAGYGEDITIDAYYVITNKGVAKVEYVHGSEATHKSGFDQLANSVKSKQ